MSRDPSSSGAAIRAALQQEFQQIPLKRHAPPTVPDHTLIQPIGTGAYGDVWLARNALGTLRAVKIVYRDRFDEERPFQREFNGILKYEPVSRTHESLIQVLHVGRNDEAACFYYVMELADDADGVKSNLHEANKTGARTQQETGRETPPLQAYRPRTLQSELARHHRLPPTEAAQLTLRLAGALAHLHANGLVHRDIKPSNVIFVGGKPKLADIGLIAGVGDSRSFVGTEGFVPPEGPGTPQADLYGLGKLLYELSTGRDRMDFPQLPVDIEDLAEREAILELNEATTRACAPDLHYRYSAATELIADLSLFLAGRSLREVRKTEQHLTILKRLATAACVMVVLAALAIWLTQAEAHRAREREKASKTRALLESSLRQRAEAAEREQSRLREEAQKSRANEAALRGKAEAQELAARKKAYASDMNLLQQALGADDLGRAQELLERQRPQPGEMDLRGWEWRYFWQFCQSDSAFTLCQRSNSVISVSFSGDGKLLAAGTYEGETTVWDVASRKMIWRHNVPGLGPVRLAFAPKASLLALYDASGDSRNVLIWDSEAKTELQKLPLAGALRDLVFTPDGRLFTAELGSTNAVTAWDVSSGRMLGRFAARVANYDMGNVFNVTRDGTRFVQAIRGLYHTVRLVDTESSVESIFKVTDELTTAMAFSRDNRILFTGAGYADGAVKLWDVASGQFAGELDGHRSWVSCLKLLPDGKTLASASADRTVRLWDVETRKPVRTLHGHGGELWTIDASSDGRWLASGGKDGQVIFWDLNSSTNRPPAFSTFWAQGMEWFFYSPDSRLIGAPGEHLLEFRDAQTLALTNQPGLSLPNARTFAFSSDMIFLATINTAGEMTVWDLRTHELAANFPSQPILVRAGGIAFRCGGKSIITLGDDHTVREWDTGTWEQTRSWKVNENAVSSFVSITADLMATGTEDGMFEIIPLFAPEKRRQFKGQTRVTKIALSPDGKTFADSSENGAVELWDTEGLTRKALLRGVLLGYHSVAISPDGERVAAGSNGQEAIKLWDLESHEEVATLSGRGSFFSQVRFSPDGSTLSCRNWNAQVHFWRAPSWKEIEAAEQGRAVVVP